MESREERGAECGGAVTPGSEMLGARGLFAVKALSTQF